jgi:hypothetical protein
MTAAVARVFTLDVGGKPTLAFAASTHREALQMRKEKWLQADLISEKTNGIPVWDGNAKLSVRAATDGEATLYGDGAAAAVPSDDLLLVYLIELDAQ